MPQAKQKKKKADSSYEEIKVEIDDMSGFLAFYDQDRDEIYHLKVGSSLAELIPQLINIYNEKSSDFYFFACICFHQFSC